MIPQNRDGRWLAVNRQMWRALGDGSDPRGDGVSACMQGGEQGFGSSGRDGGQQAAAGLRIEQQIAAWARGQID